MTIDPFDWLDSFETYDISPELGNFERVIMYAKAFFCGLKIKETQIVSMGANSQTQDATYSDYKEYEGIKFPSKKTGSMGPQTVEFNLIEVKVNQGVAEEDFK